MEGPVLSLAASPTLWDQHSNRGRVDRQPHGGGGAGGGTGSTNPRGGAGISWSFPGEGPGGGVCIPRLHPPVLPLGTVLGEVPASPSPPLGMVLGEVPASPGPGMHRKRGGKPACRPRAPARDRAALSGAMSSSPPPPKPKLAEERQCGPGQGEAVSAFPTLFLACSVCPGLSSQIFKVKAGFSFPVPSIWHRQV